MSCDKYRNPVDRFEILRNGEHVGYIFIYGYAIKASFKAPKGYIFK